MLKPSNSSLKKLVVFLVAIPLLGAAVGAGAASRVFAPHIDDEFASDMFSRWGRMEGIEVKWEADYDISLPPADTSGEPAFQITVTSAVKAMGRYMSEANAASLKQEYAVKASRPAPLFGCFYQKSQTFVVRQQGQPPCDKKLSTKG